MAATHHSFERPWLAKVVVQHHVSKGTGACSDELCKVLRTYLDSLLLIEA